MSFLEQLLEHNIDPETVYRRNMPGIVEHLKMASIETNESLRAVFGPRYQVDELALLFPHKERVMDFLTPLVELEGFELFNAASDRVMTTPLPTEYDVRYWFVSTPWGARLELMVVTDGYSPYHRMLQNLAESGAVTAIAAHASFKVEDDAAYANAVVSLTKSNYDLYQHCKSSYGKFSYFGHRVDFGTERKERWTIKPRINLRDDK